MHVPRCIRLSLLALLLSGCIAPALLLPSQTDLMLALLKPLVGFDPNKVNLFEQPIIRNRMTALLGPHYDTAMNLLRTADKIQREGALYYVVSRYTPVPALAQKAGLVWNADTNQMAVGMLKGDSTQIFYEVVEESIQTALAEPGAAVARSVDEEKARAGQRIDETAGAAVREVMPSWPHEIAEWLHPEKIIRDAVRTKVDEAAARAVDSAVKSVVPAADRP